MSKATDDVLAERQRQMTVEGWTEGHDDEHTDESLALAAACYAKPASQQRFVRHWAEDRVGWPKAYSVPDLWPTSWAPSWWKPMGRRRDLVRAAALLIAEIERLDRAAAHQP